MNTMLAKRLKELRKESKRTQDNVASVIGIGRTTYSEYERGGIAPPADKIFRLAELFGVPVDYLAGMDDPWFLERYRRNTIVICTGQGAWEEDSIRHTRRMERILAGKDIPAWFDYWGYDVNHDWPWWRLQMPYFLGELAKQGRL